MKAVLDTNVWLDWLVFGDASVAPIARGVERGAIVVLGSDETRAEWLSVIARPQFGLHARARAEAAAAYDRVVRRSAPAPSCALLCRDPDDQKFVDLAIAEGAGWLVTRDKALLALARRAARWHALAIVRPDSGPLHAALAAAAAIL
ncbi:MAG TPA: putative toxin-antitoxin system toxin component, PIN family [Burkholderiaceae bacterium]|jgi:putative PIN family toxin of toxin-antitoxin system|nr:putative toxin-antitoxin system toxin component, PIN family [Burkholderiaceae bacterium]